MIPHFCLQIIILFLKMGDTLSLSIRASSSSSVGSASINKEESGGNTVISVLYNPHAFESLNMLGYFPQSFKEILRRSEVSL